MHRFWKALASRAGSRAGMTLTEVLLGLAVFLTGAVSIIGLFVAASVLHAEASNRRTASFIAEELLAEAQGMPFRDIFAKTSIQGGALGVGATTVTVQTTVATEDYPAASFDLYPVRQSFFPLLTGQSTSRQQGPLLIGSEGLWYQGRTATTFAVTRSAWGIAQPAQVDDPVLQPRSWFYVVSSNMTANDPAVSVLGNPGSSPQDPSGSNDGAPPTGYIVVDEEWMHYASRDDTGFTIDARGIGGTTATAHVAGTPVTVAREHLLYPDFYYTMQFYPVNANGAESRLLISVAYKTGKMFRAWFFRSVYTPAEL
jgi:hypothetical protein